jgi:predicted nuclease of restriction endonuclease-like (RecB) superfamily
MMNIDKNIITTITTDIRESRLRAGVEVNKIMLQLYWRIGSVISELEENGHSLERIISNLTKELENIYSETISFSEDNLSYMYRFYKAYPDIEKVQTVLAQLPWGYHRVLLKEVYTYEERIYYARLAIKHGWGLERLKTVILSDKKIET